MLKKSQYVCPKCGYKTEASAGTPRSCFRCNSRMEEKVLVVTKVALVAEAKPTPPEGRVMTESGRKKKRNRRITK